MFDRQQCKDYIEELRQLRSGLKPEHYLVLTTPGKVLELLERMKASQPELFAEVIGHRRKFEELSTTWRGKVDNTLLSARQAALDTHLLRLIEDAQTRLDRLAPPRSVAEPSMPMPAGGGNPPGKRIVSNPSEPVVSNDPKVIADLLAARVQIQNAEGERNEALRERDTEKRSHAATRQSLERAERKLAVSLTEKATLQTELDQVRAELTQTNLQSEKQKALSESLTATLRRAQEKNGSLEKEKLALTGELETLRQENERLRQRLATQRDLAALQKALNAKQETFPPAFRRFTEELLELSEVVAQGQTAALRDRLESLDLYLYRPPMPFGLLATEAGGAAALDDLMRVVVLQGVLHERVRVLGLRVLNPAPGAAYDPRQHTYTEQDLVWINDAPHLHNTVAGVRRIGYRYGREVLRKAEIRRYVVPGETLEPPDLPEPLEETAAPDETADEASPPTEKEAKAEAVVKSDRSESEDSPLPPSVAPPQDDYGDLLAQAEGNKRGAL